MAKPSQKSWRRPLVFERRHEKLATVSVFVKRLIGSLAIALTLIALVLMIGLAGYHYLAGFNWVDSLLEASMLLGGMGPVNQLPDDAAKIFASAYALFSGLIFIAVMGWCSRPSSIASCTSFMLMRRMLISDWVAPMTAPGCSRVYAAFRQGLLAQPFYGVATDSNGCSPLQRAFLNRLQPR